MGDPGRWEISRVGERLSHVTPGSATHNCRRLDSLAGFPLSNGRTPLLLSVRMLRCMARIIPELLARLDLAGEFESGDYVLYAQATDASGNLSGDQQMEIRFTVVDETRVSDVLNYPNPFAISTDFVFTLTGNEIPEVFTIQIMDVSGKMVREINKEELSNLKIGLNRPAYRWNGTDESGNRLANGIYFYRILTSHNWDRFGHLNNSAIDNYFKNGFGKLVIMR